MYTLVALLVCLYQDEVPYTKDEGKLVRKVRTQSHGSNVLDNRAMIALVAFKFILFAVLVLLFAEHQ